jgi:hypothetical protein
MRAIRSNSEAGLDGLTLVDIVDPGRSLTFIGIFMLLPMLTGVDLRRHGQILRDVAATVDVGHLRPPPASLWIRPPTPI